MDKATNSNSDTSNKSDDSSDFTLSSLDVAIYEELEKDYEHTEDEQDSLPSDSSDEQYNANYGDDEDSQKSDSGEQIYTATHLFFDLQWDKLPPMKNKRFCEAIHSFRLLKKITKDLYKGKTFQKGVLQSIKTRKTKLKVALPVKKKTRMWAVKRRNAQMSFYIQTTPKINHRPFQPLCQNRPRTGTAPNDRPNSPQPSTSGAPAKPSILKKPSDFKPGETKTKSKKKVTFKLPCNLFNCHKKK